MCTSYLQEAECDCEHNTCGSHCETCCPLYNQEEWRKGNPWDSAACQECQCFGHSSSCHYDPEIARSRLSLDTQGRFSGGGVCDNCTVRIKLLLILFVLILIKLKILNHTISPST